MRRRSRQRANESLREVRRMLTPRKRSVWNSFREPRIEKKGEKKGDEKRKKNESFNFACQLGESDRRCELARRRRWESLGPYRRRTWHDQMTARLSFVAIDDDAAMETTPQIAQLSIASPQRRRHCRTCIYRFVFVSTARDDRAPQPSSVGRPAFPERVRYHGDQASHSFTVEPTSRWGVVELCQATCSRLLVVTMALLNKSVLDHVNTLRRPKLARLKRVVTTLSFRRVTVVQRASALGLGPKPGCDCQEWLR